MIRRANIEDIEDIMKIVRSAQLALRDLGIDQWQDGYPTSDIIKADIEIGVGHVYCDEDNTPIGYAAIVLTGEEAYTQISNWATSDNYVVIHRLCVRGDVRRHGIALQLMSEAAGQAREHSYYGFRIDTHRGNTRMLTLLNKLGFEYRGIVYYTSGERLAYDLNLNNTSAL